MKPFMGYPGGKSRAVKHITRALRYQGDEYRRVVEPFCGGGSFSLAVREAGQGCWLNDLDDDLMSLWKAAVLYTDDFCDAIMGAKVSAADFYRLRKKILKKRPEVTRRDAVIRRALDKLIVHKISFSNMGEMSGSPVGGKDQTGAWKFDCRWKPNLICNRIRKVAALGKFRLSAWTYGDVLKCVGARDFVFIDPPYVDAGVKCYKRSFGESDHVRLAEKVKKLRCDWAITYDYHPLILDLYRPWAKVYDLEFQYFMSTAYREGKAMKIGKELLITRAI